jgi:hypothetical protein
VRSPASPWRAIAELESSAPQYKGALASPYSARLATLAIGRSAETRRLLNGRQDMPERSMPAMPALRDLKKVPTPGCGQARGKPARSRGAYNAPVVAK